MNIPAERIAEDRAAYIRATGHDLGNVAVIRLAHITFPRTLWPAKPCAMCTIARRDGSTAEREGVAGYEYRSAPDGVPGPYVPVCGFHLMQSAYRIQVENTLKTLSN